MTTHTGTTNTITIEFDYDEKKLRKLERLAGNGRKTGFGVIRYRLIGFPLIAIFSTVVSLIVFNGNDGSRGSNASFILFNAIVAGILGFFMSSYERIVALTHSSNYESYHWELSYEFWDKGIEQGWKISRWNEWIFRRKFDEYAHPIFASYLYDNGPELVVTDVSGEGDQYILTFGPMSQQ